MARKLVLVGGKKPQMRKASGQGWSKEKQAEFLSVLAETCNVTRACEQAGVSSGHAYRKRKADAAFRAGWMEAVGVAYQRLELVLLDRAFNGVEKVVPWAIGYGRGNRNASGRRDLCVNSARRVAGCRPAAVDHWFGRQSVGSQCRRSRE